MISLWFFAFVAVVAIIMGGLVDIYDKERTKSAFALSLIFSGMVGIGYIFLVWMEYVYLLTS